MRNCYYSFVFLLSLSFNFAFGQNVSGIINQYAKVVSIGSNNASVDVDSPTGFEVGDSVLVIQMKGAVIYSNNNAGYGDVTDYNGAGTFEYAIICDVNGNTISFNAEFQNSFDELGSIQIVSIPKYENITVSGNLGAYPWDGNKGGIVVLSASNTITLNANIDVSAQGFMGGITDSSIYDCSWFDNFPNYEYDLSTGHGAMKGEGIANYLTLTAGKGSLANGGGGGNDHNSGGGGGGNLSSGGKGGNNNDPNSNNCNGTHPGVGGKALQNSGSSAFMGGGGGAGHANNNIITSGGTGGGIVIVMAETINGNGFSIKANGEDGSTSISDGAGGGGAGGSILLLASSISSSLTLEAKGGNGGDADGTGNDRCFGPGGGASGGTVWYRSGSTPANVTTILTGGAPGVVTNSIASCLGATNGASSGQSGVEQFGLTINTNATFANNPEIELGADTSICAGNNLNLISPEASKYVWSTGSTEQSISITTPGDYGLTAFFGGCQDSDTIFVGVETNPVHTLPEDTILCSYEGVFLDAGNEGSTYVWSTGETTQIINSKTENDYTVTITNAAGCIGVHDITVWACSNNLEIPNLITPNGDGANDTWIIESIYSYPGNHVELFDRNGAMIFEMDNYDNTWDGEGLPAATYFYVIDYNNGGNKQSGSVSIVRQK